MKPARPSPPCSPSTDCSPSTATPCCILLKKYSSDAGLPSGKQHFHALKHSIGTHILDAGEDIYFAKDWLGHKNIQNTIIYARFSTGTRDARARTVFSSNRVV